MIEETARVIKTDTDFAIVEMTRQSACSHCELNSGCGTGALGKLLGHRNRPLKVANTLQLRRGDEIIIGLPEQSFLLASALIYFLPLLGLFSFGLISSFLFYGQEWLISISAITGFFAALPVSSYLAKHHYYQQFNPRVIRKKNEPEMIFRVV